MGQEFLGMINSRASTVARRAFMFSGRAALSRACMFLTKVSVRGVSLSEMKFASAVFVSLFS